MFIRSSHFIVDFSFSNKKTDFSRHKFLIEAKKFDEVSFFILLKFFKVTNFKKMSKERKLAESLPQKIFHNYDGVISERIAQLDVNKPFKQTKTDLKPRLIVIFR